MNKTRISATIDKTTEKKLDEFFKSSKYRNKSHVIEEAILNFIEGENAK